MLSNYFSYSLRNYMKKVLKKVIFPFKYIYRKGGSSLEFVHNKQKKILEIVTSSNINVVKVVQMGKKIIVTIILVISICTNSGFKNLEVHKFYHLDTSTSQMTLEKVVEEVGYGGARGHEWSPKAKHSSKASKSSSPHLRGNRRLFSTSTSNSLKAPFNQQTPNPRYIPSLTDNVPKNNKGSIRLRSIARMDKNGEIITDYYENGKLVKVRKEPTVVEDSQLTLEGELVNPSKLSSKGRSVTQKNRFRRSSPLIQSQYELDNKEFLPCYSVEQLDIKDYHILEILKNQGQNITEYLQLTVREKLLFDYSIIEKLLGHPKTELYTNVMAQGREPVFLILNRGLGDYPIKNHIAIFERRPELGKYDYYITNYAAKDPQIEKFDLSSNSIINYEDLLGNSKTNTGPIIGKNNIQINSSPTISPTIDNNREL